MNKFLQFYAKEFSRQKNKPKLSDNYKFISKKISNRITAYIDRKFNVKSNNK